MARNNNFQHGMTDTPIWRSWRDMKTRCNNPNTKDYKNYGGRGIKVCEKWNYFINFKNDMLDSHVKGLELDRINNEEGYSKENCRWVTRSQNMENTRVNNFLEFDGMKKTLTGWAKYLKVNRSTLAQRYYCLKWSVEKTLTYKR